MPLRGDKPDLWHWTQAIAWIAFDDDQSEAGDVCGEDYLPRCENPQGAPGSMKKAIRELCNSVAAGDLEPEWGALPYSNSKFSGGSSFSRRTVFTSKIAETQATLYDVVCTQWAAPRHRREFDVLFFQRQEVLRVWPATPKAESNGQSLTDDSATLNGDVDDNGGNGSRKLGRSDYEGWEERQRELRSESSLTYKDASAQIATEICGGMAASTVERECRRIRSEREKAGGLPADNTL